MLSGFTVKMLRIKNKHFFLWVLSMTVIGLFASCTVADEVDYSLYFGQDKAIVADRLQEKGIAISESETLAGVQNVSAEKTVYGHKFQVQLCFDVNSGLLYGYREVWQGVPNEETFSMIGTLYDEMLSSFGEPSGLENEAGRIGPNLAELPLIFTDPTEPKSFMEYWRDEDAYYSNVMYCVASLPNGEVTVFFDYRD